MAFMLYIPISSCAVSLCRNLRCLNWGMVGFGTWESEVFLDFSGCCCFLMQQKVGEKWKTNFATNAKIYNVGVLLGLKIICFSR